MSAVSSAFGAYWSRHSEECAISLSLRKCPSNQGSLAISIQVWNSVRPMHLFGRFRDHDYYFRLPREEERDTQPITRSRLARLLRDKVV